MESPDVSRWLHLAALGSKLEASRQELLDLGLRNPLLNFRLATAQGVAVVHEESAPVFDVLVRQGKTMYFQGVPEPKKKNNDKGAQTPLFHQSLPDAPLQTSDLDDSTQAASERLKSSDDMNLQATESLADETIELGQEDELQLTELERQALLTDNKLQTADPIAKLEKRLLNTYYTAHTSLEEQGVNILYLALGMLTWYEDASSAQPHQAPLVLVPVLLERGTAVERFKLRFTGAEVESNLSLQAKLRANFGVQLPLAELEEDSYQLADYFAAVSAAIAGMPRWEISVNTIALSFFSFGKFMLYRDLDPATWPAHASLLNHPAIGALLDRDAGFRDAAPSVSDTAFLDTDSPATELHQVLDADSSQLLALLAVHEGRNLVIQGPPGTGKSQTIANLLAEAIGAGKKVLFVAEKMAALEVVKRRLDSLGLGAACLELHSHKANKKALHEELRATLNLGRPASAAPVEDQVSQLPQYRAALNTYALAVNAPLGRSRRTAQQVTGELLRLREVQGGVELPRLPLPKLADWTDADAIQAVALATRLQATLRKTGIPTKMLFWGSELTILLPADQDRISQALREAVTTTQELISAAAALGSLLQQSEPPIDHLAVEGLLPQAEQAHREAQVVHTGQAAAAVSTLARTGSALAQLLSLPSPESRAKVEQLPPIARRTHQEGLSAHDPALITAIAALQAVGENLASLLSVPPALDVASARSLSVTGRAELREATAAHSGEALQALQNVQKCAQQLSALLTLAPPADLAGAVALIPVARHVQAAPSLTGIAVTDAYWRQKSPSLAQAQSAAERLAILHAQFDPLLLAEAWDQALLTERQVLLAYGPKWWRFLNGSYRQARKRLQKVWRGPLPRAAEQIVTAIDAIEEAARLEQTMLEVSPLAQRLFGASWQNRQTDWAQLDQVSTYLIDTHQQISSAGLPTAVLPYLATAPDPGATLGALAALETALAILPIALGAAADSLAPSRAGLFGPPGKLSTNSFAEQISTLEAWTASCHHPEQVAPRLVALETALQHYQSMWKQMATQLNGIDLSDQAPAVETAVTQPFAAQMALLQAWAAATPAPGEVAVALAAVEAALPVHEQAIAAVVAVCSQAPELRPALTTELPHQSLADQAATLATWLSRTPPPAVLRAAVIAVEEMLSVQPPILQTLLDRLQLNQAQRYGSGVPLAAQTLENQLVTLLAWTADLPALHLVTEWNNVAADVRAAGLGALLELAESWEPAAHLLAATVQQTWLEYLQRIAFEQHPALRQFERAGHEELAGRFRLADRASLYYNRIRAMRHHHEHLPSQQAGGQMLVLKNEFAKKARHLPLRKLMQQAGHAVQAIKPIFMMSPLSVASYLPPGTVEFDLVVFDEASQVKPIEALGAIARGKQLVVVGDSKQLPPTSFFDSLTGADEVDEDNLTADIQSILELCKARQMPERMLRWHYRSLHESLIAASNHLFYDDKLVIFPSPGGKGKLGLVYHHLPTTYYERGTTRTNPEEAAAVADAVLHHARSTPQLTLGVVAFSTAQRQAIQDALEVRRRQHPETESFFNRHAYEPFFVKNLENVQGDERDVILISIGYGRTKDGYLAMSFGPLNGEGGERRLNVLITRAKQRCEVFTNLTADDLDLSRTRAKGVVALKTFLTFAQHGRLNQNEETGREMDSPFEEAVYRALTARGYILRPQVGSQGFYIDLAVVDPEQPGRYVLGIECDGAMYHSARSARDRDRLRQQVLEAVGWRLHRIWSTDWFRDPQRETERAVAAIEEARYRTALDEPDEPEPMPLLEAVPDTGLEREELPPAEVIMDAIPYPVAQLTAPIGQQELHLVPVGSLARWVAEVVAVESPVHVDEVTRRLASAAGATQVGSRIRASVARAIRLATNMERVRLENDFLWSPTMMPDEVILRDRSALPAISRKLNFIAAEEIAAAVVLVVRQSFAIDREAALLHVARLFGFLRLSEEQRQQLLSITQGLVVREQLTEVDGILRLGNVGLS